MSDDMSSAVGTSDEVDIVQRSLSTGLPAWCSYHGVTCDANGGSITYESVIQISLGSLSLVGTIPSSIGSMTSLTSIDLSINSLSGTIPSSIGLLTLLTSLNVMSNRLAGNIPSTFSKLVSLTSLYLNKNYLTMGSATTVPNGTFSSATLSGTLVLGSNCLAFTDGTISVSVTHCAPTSGKSVVLYCMEYVLSRKAAWCLMMT